MSEESGKRRNAGFAASLALAGAAITGCEAPQAEKVGTPKGSYTAAEQKEPKFAFTHAGMNADDCKGFDTLVLGADHYPSARSVDNLKKSNPNLKLYANENIAVLRRGGDTTRKYDEMKQAGVFSKVLNEGAPNEEGIADLKNPEWRKFVKGRIERAVEKGFDIFVAGLDAVHAGEKPNPGNTEAAIDLVREIKGEHPEVKLMVERGVWIEGKGYSTATIEAIKPDAVLTIDPDPKNVKLLQDLKNKPGFEKIEIFSHDTGIQKDASPDSRRKAGLIPSPGNDLGEKPPRPSLSI